MLTRTLAALALVLAAAMATDWSQAQPVTVVAKDYAFEPSRLTLHVGTAYRLHIENHGKDNHEFTAPAFFQNVEIRDPASVNADRTEVVIAAGEQKDVYLVPRKAGHYPLSCADHDWAGMTGEIVVE
jgi:plastocyanin